MKIPWYLMAKGKGGGGYKTASGPIVSVSDALAAPLRSLLVNIEPVQEGSGDPSPDNVRPISGWTEANLWRTGKNLLPNISGARYADSIYIGQADGTTYPLHLFAGVPYTISFQTNISGATAYAKENGGSAERIGVSGETYTPQKDMYVQMWVYGSGLTSVADWQLELGSTATPYEPYSSNQFTIQLGQTVYGGTLDVLSGVLRVDRAMVDLGTLSWGESVDRFSSKSIINSIFRQSAWGTGNPIAKCSCYKYGSVVVGSSADKVVGVYDGTVYVRDTTYSISDIQSFVTAMSGVQLVYELATPITIPLSSITVETLAGTNNLWADTGDVTVEYLSAGGADPDLMKLAVAFMGRR